jgi:sulfur carrier protein
MKLTLNGQAREVAIGVTLSELLASLQLADKMVLVERNGDAVPRADFQVITVCEGDIIEIVRMVGGG